MSKDKEKSMSQLTVLHEVKNQNERAPIEERLKSVNSAVSQIEKQFGKGSILKLGDRANVEFPHIETGIISFDKATGIGGLPRGRIIEVYGPESVGKSSFCLNAVAKTQQSGGIAAYIDFEHSIDCAFAEKLGVNVDSLLISQPSSGEEGLEILESLVRSNAIDIAIVDSVSAITPKAELEGDMGQAVMGAQARLMSQAMRKLTGAIATSKTTVIFINQIRMKLAVMYGSPETTSGGGALKYFASMRIDLRRKEQIKVGGETGEVIGNSIKAKLVKNKVASPFREAEFDFYFATGFDFEGSALKVGVATGVIERSGTWFSFEGERIGNGSKNVSLFLKDNPEIFRKILDAIKLAELKPKAEAKFEVDPDTGELLK